MTRDLRILVLVADSHMRSQLFRTFDRKGFGVITAQKINEAKLLCSGDMRIDGAIIEQALPDGSGIDFATHLQRMNSQCEVVCLTDETFNYHAIPQSLAQICFTPKNSDLLNLIQLIEKLIHDHPKSPSVSLPTNQGHPRLLAQNIIGESESIHQVLDLVQRVADSEANILIQGESGTGKELIAKAIHAKSSRANQPFVAINCGAIPAELLESELFGHVKGAFTGAIANRAGRFELANGGTIFLDEIGDLEPSLQVKLLRVLQEKSFEPVGSTRTMAVDVRVIAATNVNLEEAVSRGRFREDLFYRLNVIPIAVPALRERKTDIPLLIQHFIKTFSKKNRGITGFSSDSLNCLAQYAWPGNIRELENLVERLSILKGYGQVELSDLPVKYRQGMSASSKAVAQGHTSSSELVSFNLPDDGLDFNTAVDQFENSLILRALEKTRWNRNQAALLLRLNRTTLVEKIKKKGLKPSDDAENLSDFNSDGDLPVKPSPVRDAEI